MILPVTRIGAKPVAISPPIRFSGLFDSILVNHEQSRLIKMGLYRQQPPPFQPNNIYMTYDNEQYLNLILNLIDQAKESIKIDCFYIGGKLGETILEHLERKGQEGVKIYYRGDHSRGLANRHLVMPTKRRLSRLGRRLSRLFYYPFKRRHPFQVVGVNHNKLFIVDNKVCLLTSKNPAEGDLLNRDTTMVITGPLVWDLVTQFNSYWFKMTDQFLTDKPGKHPIEPLPSHLGGKLESVQARPLVSSKNRKHAYWGILSNIRRAKRSIKIHAFCLSNKEIRKELLEAAKRGVNVQILLNSSEEYLLRVINIVTFRDFLKAAKKYTNLQMRAFKHKTLQEMDQPKRRDLHHYKNHNKMMIVDNERVILGSTNFSNADVWLQENISVEIQGGQPLEKAIELFDLDWRENSIPVTPPGPLEKSALWLSKLLFEF